MDPSGDRDRAKTHERPWRRARAALQQRSRHYSEFPGKMATFYSGRNFNRLKGSGPACIR